MFRAGRRGWKEAGENSGDHSPLLNLWPTLWPFVEKQGRQSPVGPSPHTLTPVLETGPPKNLEEQQEGEKRMRRGGTMAFSSVAEVAAEMFRFVSKAATGVPPSPLSPSPHLPPLIAQKGAMALT